MKRSVRTNEAKKVPINTFNINPNNMRFLESRIFLIIS